MIYPSVTESIVNSLKETAMHYRAMLLTASELGMETPALQRLEAYRIEEIAG